MNNKNITKKQHYIPQFYLKYFADKNSKLQALDIKNSRISLPKSCSSLGYKHYFYAVKTGTPDEVSQHIEQWLQQFENAIARELPGIINKILDNDHIGNDDRYILAVFMSMLWLRSPGMRVQLNKMEEDMTKQMMRFYTKEQVDSYVRKTGNNMSEIDRSRLIDAMKTGSFNLRFNNASHLRFMTKTLGFDGPGFANMFFGQKWKIYIAKGKKRFVTSDTPVVEWWEPPQTFYGASFLERNKYFALTPEILFELTYPLGSAKIKRKTIFEGDDDKVALYNILIAAHSQEFTYSGEKTLLDNLLSGRAKPGPIERIYYEKFQLPWDEYKKKNKNNIS